MAEVQQTIQSTRQEWCIIRHNENVDLDKVVLTVFDEADNVLVDMEWKAEDFFKKMLDLQYEYGR